MPGIYESVIAGDYAAGSPLDAVSDEVDPTSALPEMDLGMYERIFGTGTTGTDAPAGTEVPVYGPADRGPAMHSEDITAVGGKAGKIVRAAKSLIGTPYVWGGTGTNGVDCSGLVQLAYKAAGINLPRVSYQQAGAGKRVSIGNLQPGDLVAWDNSSRNNGADHIAIYLGGGRIIEAARPGTNVRIRKLGNDEGAWGVRILGGN